MIARAFSPSGHTVFFSANRFAVRIVGNCKQVSDVPKRTCAFVKIPMTLHLVPAYPNFVTCQISPYPGSDFSLFMVHYHGIGKILK
jgi:hypothetical protein